MNVNKSTKKLIFALILLALISIPAITSSLSVLKEKEEERLAYQKLLNEEEERLAKEKAIKEAEMKLEQQNYLMGKFNPEERKDFVPIPKEYSVNKNIMYLRQEALNAFSEMRDAALIDKIDLKIASATRNFSYQKSIWENKWSGYTLVNGKNLTKSIPDGLKRFQKILEYSSAPGTSRHHWGTDIDINDANKEYFEKETGKKVYEWLNINAVKFGFCQPYNTKGENRKTGYNEEKWHWSYVPLARTFTEQYKNLIQTENINGFLGEEYAPQLNLINDYVLGINPECL